jgi:hypothetical protein
MISRLLLTASLLLLAPVSLASSVSGIWPGGGGGGGGGSKAFDVVLDITDETAATVCATMTEAATTLMKNGGSLLITGTPPASITTAQFHADFDGGGNDIDHSICLAAIAADDYEDVDSDGSDDYPTVEAAAQSVVDDSAYKRLRLDFDDCWVIDTSSQTYPAAFAHFGGEYLFGHQNVSVEHMYIEGSLCVKPNTVTVNAAFDGTGVQVGVPFKADPGPGEAHDETFVALFNSGITRGSFENFTLRYQNTAGQDEDDIAYIGWDGGGTDLINQPRVHNINGGVGVLCYGIGCSGVFPGIENKAAVVGIALGDPRRACYPQSMEQPLDTTGEGTVGAKTCVGVTVIGGNTEGGSADENYAFVATAPERVNIIRHHLEIGAGGGDARDDNHTLIGAGVCHDTSGSTTTEDGQWCAVDADCTGGTDGDTGNEGDLCVIVSDVTACTATDEPWEGCTGVGTGTPVPDDGFTEMRGIWFQGENVGQLAFGPGATTGGQAFQDTWTLAKFENTHVSPSTICEESNCSNDSDDDGDGQIDEYLLFKINADADLTIDFTGGVYNSGNDAGEINDDTGQNYTILTRTSVTGVLYQATAGQTVDQEFTSSFVDLDAVWSETSDINGVFTTNSDEICYTGSDTLDVIASVAFSATTDGAVTDAQYGFGEGTTGATAQSGEIWLRDHGASGTTGMGAIQQYRQLSTKSGSATTVRLERRAWARSSSTDNCRLAIACP